MKGSKKATKCYVEYLKRISPVIQKSQIYRGDCKCLTHVSLLFVVLTSSVLPVYNLDFIPIKNKNKTNVVIIRNIKSYLFSSILCLGFHIQILVSENVRVFFFSFIFFGISVKCRDSKAVIAILRRGKRTSGNRGTTLSIDKQKNGYL